MVTNIEYQKFSDEFLPQITVCPKVAKGVGYFKDKELAKHGIDKDTYLYTKNKFRWASRNSSLSAEALQNQITWRLEEMVMSLDWYEVGGGLESAAIKDIAHLWTKARWGVYKYACYKLDLSKIKKGSTRLKKFAVNSLFPGGIQLFLHKVNQANDESLGTLMEVKSEPRYFPVAIPSMGAHVSLKVIRGVSTAKHPCTKTAYDSTFTSVVTQQMMTVAGCVVPWVDRRAGAPICEGGKAANKAHEAYNRLTSLGLYERDEVAPPCEFYIPTSKESTNFGPNFNNATAIVWITFSPQVHEYYELSLIIFRFPEG